MPSPSPSTRLCPFIILSKKQKPMTYNQVAKWFCIFFYINAAFFFIFKTETEKANYFESVNPIDLDLICWVDHAISNYVYSNLTAMTASQVTRKLAWISTSVTLFVTVCDCIFIELLNLHIISGIKMCKYVNVCTIHGAISDPIIPFTIIVKCEQARNAENTHFALLKPMSLPL